jgi:DNA-binding GntR family transcriptional regulator
VSSAGETIYAELRRRLMAGHYAPGTQLKEEAIASELAVSRTPVRTALRRLVQEGQLEAHANRGAFVAEWTARDTNEVFELRCLLEAHAAALAAERASPEQIAELTALNRRMAELSRKPSLERISELQTLNSRFHHIVLAAAGSPRLSAMTRPLIDWPLTIGTFYFFSENDLARSVHHHNDLIAAISNRDAVLAKRTMEVHLRRSNIIYQSQRASKTKSTK